MPDAASPSTIDRDELKRWIDEERPFVLLDVLPRSAWEECHLPGARTACVYETDFLEQATEQAPDKGAEVVVYCSSGASHASTDAADRLARAGYGNVCVLEGGREAWHEAGYPLEGEYRPWDPAAELAEPEDGEYAVDTEKSVVGWVGRNLGGSHDGTLRLKGGRVAVKDGVIESASFEIDMGSIQVADLSGEMAELLRKHLESEDFFAVATHPTATVAIAGVTPIDGATAGAPNFTAKGALTLRGETGDISFPAIVAARDGGELALEAHFDIDRTRWGVNYGSGKLYDRLGMHLVNDHLSVQVRVVARTPEAEIRKPQA